ncbi:MAG: monovalent cation/H(+) antiporter subunit G [Acidothermaceae bacterium]
MQILTDVLLFLGVAIVVASSCAALWLRGVFVRLHFLSPVTSLGGPLIGIALGLENGWGLTTGLILFTVLLLAFSGPVVEVATARVMAQREAIVMEESPE